MNRTWRLAVAAAVVAGAWWLSRCLPSRLGESRPATTTAASQASLLSAGTNRQPEGRPGEKARPLVAQKESIAADLAELTKQYDYAGALGWDAAKALVQRREQAARDLEARLAKLGPGGAAQIAAAYADTTDTRNRIVLIHALGKCDDDQAVDVLQRLLSGEGAYSLQHEVLLALSQRVDGPSTLALDDVLTSSDNQQLRYLAAVGLRGREDALPILEDHIATETSQDVQSASIRSIAAIGTDAARQALANISQNAPTLQTRQAALQMLNRQ